MTTKCELNYTHIKTNKQVGTRTLLANTQYCTFTKEKNM